MLGMLEQRELQLLDGARRGGDGAAAYFLSVGEPFPLALCAPPGSGTWREGQQPELQALDMLEQFELQLLDPLEQLELDFGDRAAA